MVDRGLSGRRPLVSIDETAGLPDGIAVEAEGHLWAALFGDAVHRYQPGGRLDAKADVPVRQVTACTFGDPRLDQLFITTSRLGLGPAAEPAAGAIVRADVGVAGLPASAFAGWPNRPRQHAKNDAVPVVYAGRITVLQVADDQTGRVDSWIWSVRLAKTRSAASSACRAGHVRVNGARVKPAHPIRAGDEVRLRQDGRERIVVVTQVISKRVSAPVAAECYIDHSPPPLPRDTVIPVAVRERGAGRPTKRERRSIDKLLGRKTR